MRFAGLCEICLQSIQSGAFSALNAVLGAGRRYEMMADLAFLTATGAREMKAMSMESGAASRACVPSGFYIARRLPGDQNRNIR